MRIRALDVLAARIDGLPVQLDSCTLAARTDAVGNVAWEASGWIRGGGPAILERPGAADVFPIALETDEGALSGSATVSLTAAGGSHPVGGQLRLGLPRRPRPVRIALSAALPTLAWLAAASPLVLVPTTL